MAEPLRLLLIEDSEEDEMLLVRELSRSGYTLDYRRVWTAASLEEALAVPWTIVLSDWSMPGLNGLDAFRIVRGRDADVPFIIISGTIGEEVAVEALKAGVDDFVVKGKFARLAPAIDRTCREAAVRRRQREADRGLEEQRREIERSERLLRAVLESVPDGLLVANHARELVACNRVARRLLRLEPTDISVDAAHRTLRFLQPDRVTPLAKEHAPLTRALAGESVLGSEIFVTDGVQSWHFHASAQPLVEESETTAAVVLFRDVTHERATREQLMVSDRMASVGMLAAGVAHEINNPLAAVLANIELVTSTIGSGPDFAEIREMLADARCAADRVRQIVRDLKIFSRHEHTGDGAVDIRHVLDSTLRMAWNEIRHRAQLIKDYGETPLVRGSESRLGQVFLNLIINAAQAVPEGAAERNTIRVATRTTGQAVIVEVTDSGAGMSGDILRHLFTPFFTTKSPGEGMGLGLAIAYRIVTTMGGTIEVDSEPGRGTTFRVTLPAASAEDEVIARPAVRPEPARRGKILIVDDEVMVCTALRRLLSREHDVHVTMRATEALELVTKGAAFDVILCDLMMPHMTGMELHDRLEELGQAERIIFLTGGAFTTSAREFLDRVPNQRIEKPFDQRLLQALVNARVR